MRIGKIIGAIVNFLLDRKSISLSVGIVVERDWQEIDQLLKGVSPSQLKQALIIADRSLDTVLRDVSMGDGMAERMKNAQNLFSPQTYQKLWDAHKIRNALIHESGFEVQYFVLKAHVANIKSGLRELGVKV